MQQKQGYLVRHQPLCQISIIHVVPQQGVFLVWIRTLCQQLIATPCQRRVFLVSKHLLYGQFSQGLLMSPKRSTVASPTIVACFRNHHQRLPTYVPAPAGVTRQEFQQPYSRAPVLKPVPATTLYNPDESGGDPGRRGHQNCPRRRQKRSPRRSQNTETVIRSWHLVRAPSPVDGEVGFCEVLDIWRVARPPRCQHARWNAVPRVPWLQENLTSTLSNIS